MLLSITEVAEKAFDYIVIGGGTSGLVLATRLSEDSSVTVLVLEAGGANLEDSTILIPGQHQRQFNDPNYDWAFKTVEQKHSSNRSIQWPRGKCLGGSSALNFLLWNKPAKEYLNAFTELGNAGWDWANFYKYSKKAEKFIRPTRDVDVLTYNMEHHGTEGPVITSFPSVISHLEKPVMEAMVNLGIKRVSESSSGMTSGTTVVPLTINPETHLRVYSTNGYYLPNKLRKNLFILVHAHVSRILLKTNTDGSFTATGVEFIYEAQRYETKVTRDVCLAAGAIMSPQILELSGIGNSDILNQVGIEVKIDLPEVGENVQEHLYTAISYEVKTPIINGHEINTYDILYDMEELMKHFSMHATGEGIFNLMPTGLTFLSLKAISPNAEKLHKTLTETVLSGIQSQKWNTGLVKQYQLQLKHIQDEIASLEVAVSPGLVVPPLVPDATKKHLSLGVFLNAPFSRGSIHIASSDPLDPPVIDPHMFENEYDLQALVELVKFNRRVAKTPPLRDILKEEETVPGPQVQTDEQIADWLKQVIGTTFHTVGSCSMLPREDGGVVNSKLQVYGTTNIRVTDLSIVPLHIGSHTQALAYAIGEQAADIIKGIL